MRLPRRENLTPTVVAEKAAEVLDPSRLAARWWTRTTSLPPFCLTIAYRARYADAIRALVDQVPDGSTVALWAVDEVAPQLQAWTVGTGRGRRFSLHERMREQCAPAQDAHWLLSDDDIDPRTLDLQLLVKIAASAGIDVYGPSHARNSYFSHDYTRRRPLSVVRESDFVEIGPLVGFSPTAQERLLPLPELSGFEWGMEAYWTPRTQAGLRCALVDALPLTHTSPPGKNYDADAEYQASLSALARHGFRNMAELMVTTATWRPWTARAPWMAAAGA